MQREPSALTAARIIAVLAVLLACAALALHVPGHVSMDSSMQLYEAATGQAVSWNPPFMSALMRWMGGGEIAMAGIVLCSTLLVYGGLGGIAASGVQSSSDRSAWWRAALCAALLLNPVLLIYVGIVWKDVLFGAMLVAAVAFAHFASLAESRRALAWACASALLLALAAQVRQQGVFMAPVLLLAAILALVQDRGLDRAGKLARAAAVAGVFVCALLASRAMVGRTIHADNASTSVGFRSIMSYDLLGMIARSRTPTAELPLHISEAQRQAVAHSYSSFRVDYVQRSELASSWLLAMDDATLRQSWRAMLRAEPGAFLSHKWGVFLSVTDFNGVQYCLPVHIGVDGNSEYLRAAGVAEGRDARDQLVYDIAIRYRDWPVYRHWAYALLLVAGLVAGWRARLPKRTRGLILVTGGAAGLFYLSYLPTAISCDFRYLFGTIPLVTAMWLMLLTGARVGKGPENAP
jgi:hypothetical protein